MRNVPWGHGHHGGRGSNWEVARAGGRQRWGGVATKAGVQRRGRLGQVRQGEGGGCTPAADVSHGLLALSGADGSWVLAHRGWLLSFHVHSPRSQLLLTSGCMDWFYSASQSRVQRGLLAV